MPAGLASLVVLPPWVDRTCTLTPAPGETSTEYSGAAGSEEDRSMTPALALELELVWEVTSALTLPSPTNGADTKWNWSEVPVMSVPPPVMVHVPVPGS